MSRWKYEIDSEAKSLRDAIDSDNLDGIKTFGIAVVKKCKTFFSKVSDEYELSQLDDIIEDFEMLSTDVDDYDSEEELNEAYDFVLGELYDFCDGYRIWIGLN